MSAASLPILALNPGSSSVKAAVRDPALAVSITVQRIGSDRGTMTVSSGTRREERAFAGGVPQAVGVIAAELATRGIDPAAVSHRVVHGGPSHYLPTHVDAALLADLSAAIPLAPLHLPGDLAAIGHAQRAWPEAAHIACFDTGFHHDLPAISVRLPVPERIARLGVRRYGFHGLSVQSVLHDHPDLGNVVVAHLGSGCSVTAVAEGRPRHTTMSLTPTGGMISATRTGDLDPEIVLYLVQQHGFGVDELRGLFDHQAGIAGIAGGRHDLRDLLGADDEAARLALDIFVADAAMAIAGCVTTLGSWDSLVFTGGVGEHAGELREQICARLLGLRAGRGAGSGASGGGGDPSARLTATGVRTLVAAADEEATLDRLARALLAH